MSPLPYRMLVDDRYGTMAFFDWFSVRVRFVCWCVIMPVYVCEWCTLLHYAVLARTSPKKLFSYGFI